MKLGLAGKFIVHKQKVMMQDGQPVLDAKGNQVLIGESEKVTEFDNLITNTGLNGIGTNEKVNTFYLSSDTAEPTVNDNSIVGLMGTSTDIQSQGEGQSSISTPPFFNTYFMTMRFAAGIATGNITKLLTGWGVDGIWSSALIKDISGNPTTITKLPDEILDVTYEVRHYIPHNQAKSVVTISGVKYNVTSMAMLLTGKWIGAGLMPSINMKTAYLGDEGVFGTIYEYPQWVETNGAYITKKPYVVGSYKLNFELYAEVSAANYSSGIRYTTISGEYNSVAWKFRLAKVSDGTALMKTADYTLTMPPITISWGRYVAP